MGTVPYQIENEKSLYQNWRQRNNRYSWWHARAERRYPYRANGCLDELNAVIGIVRSMLAAEDGWQELLHAVQRELMVVMSHVATPSGVVNPNPLSAAELTLRCEQEMDAMTVLLTDERYFLLPGGTPISAQLQFARTVARRAERRLWTLHRQDPVNEDILRFINRLSDLFFVMARMEMQRQDWPEEKWQEFAYKRKRQ